MTTTTRFISMAAAALVAAIMTACAGADELTDTPQQPENTSKTITLTTTVGFDDKAGTRALTIDYNQQQCVKTFAANDQMAVIYKNTSGDTKKAVADITSGDGTKSATFTVTLEDPKTDAPIRYIYPAAMAKETVAPDAAIDDAGTVDLTNLNAQDGTMGSLGSALDLCTYDAASWTSGELPAGTLSNQLAVLAVTVKDAGGAYDITSGIKGLTVSDGTNSYTATGCDADGHIYLAMLPTDNADITVTATDGLINYEKTLADKKTYEASNFYNVGWRMMPTKTTPLTMEALTAGDIVVKTPVAAMKYSVNGGSRTRTNGSTTTISVRAGDKVQFYGNNNYYCVSESNHNYIAGGTAQVKVYGNIMSLLDETDFATKTTLSTTNPYAFAYFFYGNTNLTDASGLLLPATTLSVGCYAVMFEYCTNLTIAPVLPAETLVTHCYYNMFQHCHSLCSVTCLATNISATWCTEGWLNWVPASGTFTTPSTTHWTPGDSGIPNGWTRVDY